MATLVKLVDGQVTFNGFIAATGVVSGGGNRIDIVIDGVPHELHFNPGPPKHYESSVPPEPKILIAVADDYTGVASKNNSGGAIAFSQP